MLYKLSINLNDAKFFSLAFIMKSQSKSIVAGKFDLLENKI